MVVVPVAILWFGFVLHGLSLAEQQEKHPRNILNELWRQKETWRATAIKGAAVLDKRLNKSSTQVSFQQICNLNRKDLMKLGNSVIQQENTAADDNTPQEFWGHFYVHRIQDLIRFDSKSAQHREYILAVVLTFIAFPVLQASPVFHAVPFENLKRDLLDPTRGFKNTPTILPTHFQVSSNLLQMSQLPGHHLPAFQHCPYGPALWL